MAGTSTGGGTERGDNTQGDNTHGDDTHGDDTHGDDTKSASPGSNLGDAEVEVRWADIVAQLGELAPGNDGRNEAGAAGTGAPPDTEAPRPAAPAHVVARAAGPRDWPVTPEVEALEDAESHFTPPDPGPVLTSHDPLATLAWVGAVGIPLLAVIALIVRSFVSPMQVPGWVGPAVAVVFLASVAVLVWRMPHRRDPSHDDNDGAVV